MRQGHQDFKKAQTTVEFMLGPIKIKDGLFMGDQLAAKVPVYPPRTSSSSSATKSPTSSTPSPKQSPTSTNASGFSTSQSTGPKKRKMYPSTYPRSSIRRTTPSTPSTSSSRRPWKWDRVASSTPSTENQEPPLFWSPTSWKNTDGGLIKLWSWSTARNKVSKSDRIIWGKCNN